LWKGMVSSPMRTSNSRLNWFIPVWRDIFSSSRRLFWFLRSLFKLASKFCRSYCSLARALLRWLSHAAHFLRYGGLNTL
jgi:hypothetical protein